MATARTTIRCAMLAVFCLPPTGCSILSPLPTLELIKASGSATSTALMSRPGQASQTVLHEHANFHQVCIEFNPQTQVADVVPALQVALQQLSIESHVYDNVMTADKCPIWLKYSALIEWGMPPLSDRYTPYVSTAALTLQTASGQVVASSSYYVGRNFERSKWASTQEKLGPVVTALINRVPN